VTRTGPGRRRLPRRWLKLAAVMVTFATLGAPQASAAGLSVSTVAGSGAACMSAAGVAPTCGDGMSATAAQLNGPSGVAVDGAGNIFVADTADNEIRMISPAGVITTVAGTGAPCTSLAPCGVGGPATTAKLNAPRGVAVDRNGRVFVADTGDNEIRMFVPGGTMTKVAGGSACSSPPTCGDGSLAVRAGLTSPEGVAVDTAGSVFVADTGDNEIRAFIVGGNITRVAGNGAPCTDASSLEKPACGDRGPASSAQLSAPQGLAVAVDHTIVVADTGDHEIRRFAVDAAITTVAGNGAKCASAAGSKPSCGDGGGATLARLASPQGVVVDASDNVLVADTDDSEIRRVSADGMIDTIAGTGTACAAPTLSCSDGPGSAAQLNAPGGVGEGPDGLVYIADTADEKLRAVGPASSPPPPPPPASPPVATITSPAAANTFTLHQVVTLTYACHEGMEGPGLDSCGVCETPVATAAPQPCASGSGSPASVTLDTATLGPHRYTVTALSRDGQVGTAGLQYSVQRTRPLVYAPPALMATATTPCVMYRCSANPGLHATWEKSLISLPKDWCANYGCQHRMDLLPVNGFDDNLFPFNPDWAGFVLSGQPPFPRQECDQFLSHNPADWGPFCTTQQVVTDEASHGSGTICNMGRDPRSAFHGHANWEPATYEGKLEWFEHSGQGSDDDYSLDLHTLNQDGVTGDNNGGSAVHIEFDSDETIDHFDNSAWWKDFHEAVDANDTSAHGRVDNLLAEVTGMVGIDAAHTPAAELHPVYAMAIQTNPFGALKGLTDRWAIFARNWGNEGYCSSRDHPIPSGPITVRIPWLNGARGVDLAAQPRAATGVKNLGSSFSAMNIGHPGITERVIPGEAVLLTFDLSTNASHQPEYWGTIDLQWSFSHRDLPVGGLGLPAGSPGNRAPTSVVGDHPGGADKDVEGVIDRLFRHLSPKVRRTALSRIRPLIIANRAKHVRLTMRPPPIAPLVRPSALFQKSPVDRALLKHGTQQLDALCRAYKNRVPGLRGICGRAAG
jgi:hypothetical protein